MHFASMLYLLVIGFLNARLGCSIRVYWNTNEGPIVPPTPRTTQRPHQPYREPAPVWEDQSNDIPNPNPYVYVLPPPSRPRLPTNNYLTADRRPVTQENYYLYNNQNHYGNLLPPVANAPNYYQRSNRVTGLSPKYIPNVGFKYFAFVPNNNSNNNNNNNYNWKPISPSANEISSGYYSGSDKLKSKNNAKTKKYQPYEKVKYVPSNYYPYNEFALPEKTPYRNIFKKYQSPTAQQSQSQTQSPTSFIARPNIAQNSLPERTSNSVVAAKIAYSKANEKSTKSDLSKQSKVHKKVGSPTTPPNAIKDSTQKEVNPNSISKSDHT